MTVDGGGSGHGHDSEHGHDGSPEQNGRGRPTRIEAQVRLILESLEGSKAYPEDWDPAVGPDFIADSRALLVRDEDVKRVDAAVGRWLLRNRPTERPNDAGPGVSTNGVTRLPLDSRLNSTTEMLEAVDEELGRGVLTPDHVFYLTRASSCCPAKEPELDGVGTEAVPAVRNATTAGCCDGAGALVSVIDTGIFDGATGRPWMTGVDGDTELPYKNNDPAAAQIRPYAGHGAFCAGTVRTVAPKAAVYVENAFKVPEYHVHDDPAHPHEHDKSAGAAYESDLAKQAVEALQRGPDIICLAFGTPTRAQLAPLGFETLRQMVEQRKGVVVVAAAGCDGSREPFWPAAAPWTISVGSLNEACKARATWSNYGGWVDVYVPGENFVNVFPTGEYECTEPPNSGDVRTFAGLASWSGTSFSCALMAGMIAAKMSSTGLNAPQAAAILLEQARRQAMPGIGSVLHPDDICGGAAG